MRSEIGLIALAIVAIVGLVAMYGMQQHRRPGILWDVERDEQGRVVRVDPVSARSRQDDIF